MTYLNICQLSSLHCCNTATLVKSHLPDAVQIGQQILHAVTSADIPHLYSAFTATNHLSTVMFKARNGTGVRHEHVLATPVCRVPNAERRISSRRHKAIVIQVEKTNEHCVAFQGVQTGSRIEIPNLDERVHGPRNAAISLLIEHNRVHFLGVPAENVDASAGADLPNTDGAVVRSANQSVTVGGNSTYGVCMAGKNADEVWAV